MNRGNDPRHLPQHTPWAPAATPPEVALSKNTPFPFAPSGYYRIGEWSEEECVVNEGALFSSEWEIYYIDDGDGFPWAPDARPRFNGIPFEQTHPESVAVGPRYYGINMRALKAAFHPQAALDELARVEGYQAWKHGVVMPEPAKPAAPAPFPWAPKAAA